MPIPKSLMKKTWRPSVTTSHPTTQSPSSSFIPRTPWACLPSGRNSSSATLSVCPIDVVSRSSSFPPVTRTLAILSSGARVSTLRPALVRPSSSSTGKRFAVPLQVTKKTYFAPSRLLSLIATTRSSLSRVTMVPTSFPLPVFGSGRI